MKTLNKKTAKEIGFDIYILDPDSKYIAKDGDGKFTLGRWCEYPSKPRLDKRLNCFIHGSGYKIIPEQVEPTNFKGHWTESLFKIERE